MLRSRSTAPRRTRSTQRPAGSTSPDQPPPGLVVGARAVVGQRLHRRLRLPHGRDGEAHGQQIIAGPQRKQRHCVSRYAQVRINCPRRVGHGLLDVMPGASEQTRRVKIVNANWRAGPDGDHGRFEVMIVTEDDQRHVVAPSCGAMTALIALTQAGTVLTWDPADRTLIAANLVARCPGPSAPGPGSPLADAAMGLAHSGRRER